MQGRLPGISNSISNPELRSLCRSGFHSYQSSDLMESGKKPYRPYLVSCRSIKT